MNIGFVNIYSYRPHVEHLYFLAHTMQQGGAHIFALTCDGSFNSCYSKILKDKGCLTECSKCIIGGVRSFPFQNISSIKKITSSQILSDGELEQSLSSSAATLTRIACENDLNDSQLKNIREQLKKNAFATFHSTIRWIEDNKLDAVICFNGRMDMTRMITLACERLGVPYITHERTWFGHGIQLIPNGNCLSLIPINQLTSSYENKPLLQHQAELAGDLLARRFLKSNDLEWRVYNRAAEKTVWPVEHSGERILLLPSSWNEFAMHPEWKTEWKDPLDALDAFFETYHVSANQIVLRCHPNWAENIGRINGNKISKHYLDWAKKRGIYCIAPDQKVDTYDLIQEADTVVLNGGSSAIEAAACGKIVFNLGHMTYETAKFCHTMTSYSDFSTAISNSKLLTVENRHRSNLRYVYTHAARYPQFTNHVRAISTTQYKYYDGVDHQKLFDIIKSGQLKADDVTFSDMNEHENVLIEKLIDRDWKSMVINTTQDSDTHRLAIQRRASMRWVDRVRTLMPLGDR